MDSKITGTNDKEEKETLTLLKEAVIDIKAKILKAAQAPANRPLPLSTPLLLPLPIRLH